MRVLTQLLTFARQQEILMMLWSGHYCVMLDMSKVIGVNLLSGMMMVSIMALNTMLNKFIIVVLLLALSSCNTTDKYYDRPVFNGIVIGILTNL